MCFAASGPPRRRWSTSLARSASAMAASTATSRARRRCATRWPSAGSPAISDPLEEVAAAEGPAPERLRRWLDPLIAAKRQQRARGPGAVRDLRQLAGEVPRGGQGACRRRSSSSSRASSPTASSAARSRSRTPMAAARAVFDATARFHNPAHAGGWSDPAIDAGVRGGLVSPPRGADGARRSTPRFRLRFQSERKSGNYGVDVRGGHDRGVGGVAGFGCDPVSDAGPLRPLTALSAMKPGLVRDSDEYTRARNAYPVVLA